MKKSATLLGKEVGLNGQEMNRVLVHYGYLEGEPGKYYPTDKAEPYTSVKEFHRGYGGSPWYNREWSQTSFDEAILDEMVISDELKSRVRAEVSENRRDKKEKRDAYSEQYYSALEKQSSDDNQDAISTFVSEKWGEVVSNWNVKDTAIVVVLVATGVGILKAAKFLKKKWKESNESVADGENDD